MSYYPDRRLQCAVESVSERFDPIFRRFMDVSDSEQLSGSFSLMIFSEIFGLLFFYLFEWGRERVFVLSLSQKYLAAFLRFFLFFFLLFFVCLKSSIRAE